MSMSRQVSATQGMSIRVSLAKLLHPVCRGAWCAAFAQGEPNHRVRTERVLLGRVRWGGLLAVEPGKQLAGKRLVQARYTLDGQLNCIHGARLT